VFLLAIWNRRATSTGAIAGMVSGIAIMIAAKLWTSLAWTWFVVAGTLVTFSVGSLVSWIAPETPGRTPGES
jgi:solute:Na+ symporter, SSS family